LLWSLGRALLSMVCLASPALELSLLTSPLNVELARSGADQEPRDHDMPVKDLSWKPLRSHLRQGLPERSRARRPAFMAPVFAFGPSLWLTIAAGTAKGPFLPSGRSVTPSALFCVSDVWRKGGRGARIVRGQARSEKGYMTVMIWYNLHACLLFRSWLSLLFGRICRW